MLLGGLVGLYYCVGPNRLEESGYDVLLGLSAGFGGFGAVAARRGRLTRGGGGG